MQKEYFDYFIGLDIGTTSVGWAACKADGSYELLKKNAKAMWGVHLFDEAKPAVERRGFRTASRRLDRRNERLCLLRDLFAAEINNIDPFFFQRMQDSKFTIDDKIQNQKNTLFNDENYNDKKHHETYPTIYHLRSEMISNPQPHDVRLVYLAIHHILKHRGHFLLEGDSVSQVTNFDLVFDEVINTLNDYDFEFDNVDKHKVSQTLKNNQINKTTKASFLNKALNSVSKSQKAIGSLLAGGKVKLDVIFETDEYDKQSITFDCDFDSIADELASTLGENMFVIEKIKALYDWSVLANILHEKAYLSDAKKDVYDEHREDLVALKAMVKTYCPEKYKKIFHNPNEKNSYANYAYNDPSVKTQKCNQADFCKYLRSALKGIEPKEEEYIRLLAKIENGTALPKQVSAANGVIPYQVHLTELNIILKNAEAYLPFLSQKDDDGLSVSEKIRQLFTFRVPYYVGPLNPASKNAWIVKKKENEKIYPWNFDTIVDKTASANKFIEKLISKCTYIPTASVLPENSVLFSKFKIYNQLNCIKVNGEMLDVKTKNEIFKDFFVNVQKPTKLTVNRIKKYVAKANNLNEKELEITGIDADVKGSLKALLDFKAIFGEGNLPDSEIVEDLIAKITALGEDKALKLDYLNKNYSQLFTKDEIAALSKLNYNGWGSLSKEFLTEIYHIEDSTGECFNILQMLEMTSDNLMQLLSSAYSFNDSLQSYNSKLGGTGAEKFTYDMLENYYISPAVRRAVWRTLAIVDEIIKITGKKPKRIFIEMPRGPREDQKNVRKLSRKEQLLEKYKNLRKDPQHKQIIEELEKIDEEKLKSKHIFRYFLQLGRCMYSGDRIDLSRLSSDYDIDHIYPQSKIKDDSLDNTVLASKQFNANIKKDFYPLPDGCRSEKARSLWKLLLEKDLISKEKYRRLTRNDEFSVEELVGFINRQLVETQQSTKAVAQIFNDIYCKDSSSEVVYVKAKNVADFKQDFEIIKSRIVNDYHHAKDAYLSIVAGNVYHLKFTKNPRNFFVKNKDSQHYNMRRIFHFNVERNGEVAWVANRDEPNKTIVNIKKTLSKNNIQFTRYATQATGGFFDQNPMKKGLGQYPLKTSDKRLGDISKYGGYNKISGAYFFLVDYVEKSKKTRALYPVPIYLAKEIERDKTLLLDYVKNNLKLENAKILIPKIKINTLISIDGFRAHISGRSGSKIVIKNANQLVLSDELYSYVKKIESYFNKKRVDENATINERSEIKKESNLKLYDALIYKLKNTVYKIKRLSMAAIFENGRDVFEEKSLEEQCQILVNALKLFDCTAATSDLSAIGGAPKSGTLYFSYNFANIKEVSIIHQSVTGLFENKVDLKAL